MNKKKENILSRLSLIGLFVLLSACTREAQKSTSRLTIQFPNSNNSSLSVETGTIVHSEKPNFDYTVIPSNYSQVDCLIVFVGGPEEMMRGGYCEKSSDKSQHFRFGVFAGAIGKDQTVSLDVPSGPSRYVRLYGMKKPTPTSLCPGIAAEGGDSLLSGFSAPYFLGESKGTEMLPGATVNVEIPVVAAIDSNAYFDECRGPGFGAGTGGGAGPIDNSKPYLRIEGLHNFNKVENPSFARPLARGACYPFTFKTFKPCSGGQCELYTLQNPLTITTGMNLKFFTLESDCQSDVNQISTFTMSAGQSQLPATGSYYFRAPLGQIGMINTNLSSDISISATTEVNFNQPAFTNIDIGKPKIVVSNLPGSLSYGTCASGTNTTISVFEDIGATIPMISHQSLPFDGLFLMANSLGCGAQISDIASGLSSVSVNLAKPTATASGITGVAVNSVHFDSSINKYYIGGSFTAYGGKNVGNIIRLNADGSYDPSFESGLGFDGVIYSIVADGSGNVYVAGTFLNYKGISVNKLAKLDQDGKLDLNFGFDFNGDAYVLKLSGGILYVGGNFTQINGQSRAYIASIDSTSKLLTNWNPSANNVVKALAINGSTVYVGGNFTTVGGQARNRIAALDFSTGLATAWNPNSNNSINALVLDGTNLYAGGMFTTIGGQTRNRIAALDTSTGNASTWNPNSINIVNALAIDGSNLYVGGTFTTIGGQSRFRIAAIDTTTGNATSWNPNITAGTNVYAIEIKGSNVIFGGIFTAIGGAAANKVAAVDNSTGSLVATELNPFWGTLIFNPLFYDHTPFNIPQ